MRFTVQNQQEMRLSKISVAITAGLFNNEIDIKSNGWNSSFISVSINVPTFKWVKFLKPNFVSSKNCFGK